MMETLPYLLDYEYETNEAVMSRFARTFAILLRSGLPFAAVIFYFYPLTLRNEDLIITESGRSSLTFLTLGLFSGYEKNESPHITRVCEGVIFKSIKIVQEVMSKAKTSAGLKVFTSVPDQVFRTKRKGADGFKENMKIKFDGFLPKWNYVAVPSGRN